MAESILAYILMEIEIGMTDHVVDQLRHIEQATRISVTTGTYDIVMLLESSSLEELYEITVHRIHKIAGIKHTSTAVVEKMISA
ncbi:MAG: Lrp/AsnC ligand binding domain-containing protein [Candidatus Thorarchaeota archaeon]|nr:Lrp/AsnC ligand binding domain-containing protein [Candidatus Thorarchaeota archaeon]